MTKFLEDFPHLQTQALQVLETYRETNVKSGAIGTYSFTQGKGSRVRVFLNDRKAVFHEVLAKAANDSIKISSSIGH